MIFATKWHIMTYFLICLSKGGLASHRRARPLTGKPGFSQGGRASHREAGLLTGRPCLQQEGRASHRESGPLTESLCLSKRGPGLSQSASNIAKNTNENLYFHKTLNYQLRMNRNFFRFCDKTAKKFILSASQNPFGLGTLFPRSSAFR